MTPDPRALLAQIRARAEAATPAPWVVELSNWTGDEPWYQYRPATPVKGRPFGGEPLTIEEDAEFCAQARTDVPRLLAAIEAVLDLCDGSLNREECAVRCADGANVCDLCAIVDSITAALAGEAS